MSKTSEKSVDLTAKPLMTMPGHEDTIQQIAYLPGGERIVTCSADKTVRIWDVETGEQEGTTMEHEGEVYGLSVTRDGKRVLSGGEDKRMRVWDVESHELIEEWEDDTGVIWTVAVSPDDPLAASGGEKGVIVIREIKEGGRIRHAIDAGSGVPSLCFSPNGEKLACAVGNAVGEPGAIHVYDVDSGELVLGPIKDHKNIINCVLWSLDGSQLFSASLDYTIRCWNSDTGESIGEPWTSLWVDSLSLSPDGTKLASASRDRTVRFWDACSGDPIGQPLQHDNYICAVTFSPFGEFVASGGYGNKVSIWRVPWWDDSQKQAHKSLLDLPAVPVPKDRFQDEFNFLDLPTSRRPLISSYRPLPDSTTVPVGTRTQHFWRRLVSRHPSSPAHQAIELQPIQDRRFWKFPARPALTEVAAAHANERVVVARSVPKEKKKKDVKSRKRQKPRTHAGPSTVEAGPSSHAEPSGSASNAGPSNSQAGPSTSSNAAPAGRTSSFAQSTTGSDDSWDDMDCGEKCVDYLCFGPRENRERFRPWKKKSREVMEAEEQAKKAKGKGKGKQKVRRHRTPKVADPQNVVHPLPHIGPQENGIKTLSLASPPADKADPQRLISQLEEQNKQLRRQLDDAVATMQNAGMRSDGLAKKVGHLEHSSSHESDKPQGLGVLIEPSGSKSDAGLTPKFASTSPDIPPEGHPSSSTQSDLDSLQAEERAQNEKERENRLNDPASNATQSQNIVHARDHHGPESQMDVTTASAASPAADEMDVQRAILHLQEQFEQLRRRLDDPKREAEEKEGLKKDAEQLEYDGRESHKSQRPQTHAAPRNITWTRCRLRSERMKRGREPP
ncbi:WD40 repeat-like protein [Paxillus ammoniavirescens]|nr:WD40 repeat-like protein [Paxillus ammoniavirescens]